MTLTWCWLVLDVERQPAGLIVGPCDAERALDAAHARYGPLAAGVASLPSVEAQALERAIARRNSSPEMAKHDVEEERRDSGRARRRQSPVSRQEPKR